MCDPATTLRELLARLQDEATTISEAAVKDALPLCEELAEHLCARLHGTKLPPGPKLATACESATTSASESDSEVSGAHQPGKSRPSARARARLRRKQQLQWQTEEPGHEATTSNSWQQQGGTHYWQQQPWQWQAPCPDTSMPPGFIEQRQTQDEQLFLASLWSGGWQMVPVVSPMAPGSLIQPPQGPTARHGSSSSGPGSMYRSRTQSDNPAAPEHFVQAMWSGGWHMVPMSHPMGALPETDEKEEQAGQELEKDATSPTVQPSNAALMHHSECAARV